MAHLDLFRSSEQFDSSDIDFLKIDAAHAKNFLADVMGFLVHPGDLDYFIWCEEGEDRGRWPDSQVAEDGFTALACHTLDQVRLRGK